MTWTSFYKRRIGSSYAEYCALRYRPFIDMIKSINATRIVEEGCGIGTISKIIGNTACFDADHGMIQLAATNGLKAQKKCITRRIDADLIFSHGVLEHLTDETIEAVIKRGGKQIHYVPSNKYLQASYGDERLLSAAEWKSSFQPDNIIEFNDKKDLILSWGC